MNILIDFDGTVVTHEFPKIGKDVGAVPILKELVNRGHNLILFTMRSNFKGDNGPLGHKGNGTYLTDAINWFKEREIPLYGINTNPQQKYWTASPKAYGDLIIDDTCLNIPLIYNKDISDKPFVDWKIIRELLIEKEIL